jgi:hypothetical protein
MKHILSETIAALQLEKLACEEKIKTIVNGNMTSQDIMELIDLKIKVSKLTGIIIDLGGGN